MDGLPWWFNDGVPIRFWDKVSKGNDCWEWRGVVTSGGYGALRVGSRRTKTTSVMAHRLSWIINIGPIPEGMNVLHKCDNPPCVRPSHLFLGTAADNVRDCVEKGRAKGPKVIPDAVVRKVLKLYATGIMQTEIAALVGIHRQDVWDFVHGVRRTSITA